MATNNSDRRCRAFIPVRPSANQALRLEHDPATVNFTLPYGTLDFTAGGTSKVPILQFSQHFAWSVLVDRLNKSKPFDARGHFFDENSFRGISDSYDFDDDNSRRFPKAS